MNEVNPVESGQGEVVPDSSGATSGAAPSGTANPAPVAATADQLYEVKIGGNVRKVPLSELTSGYSRTQDYTAKTMALAEERRQLSAQWDQERQQLRDFLSKPENVKQLHDYLQSQNPGHTPGQPDQPLTTAQLQAALAAERTRQAQERQSMMDDLELKQTATAYRNDIDGHIKGLLDAHPELKLIRGIERTLKQAAAEQNPQDLDEAKQYIAQAATDQLGALSSHITEAQKHAALNKSNLTSRGIEPPGGSAPMPPSKQVGKMGSPEFNNDVARYLEQISQASR